MVIQKTEDSQSYSASSPDELALVNGAKYLGYELLERSEENVVQLSENGFNKTYSVKRIIEFNSDRKMMTVVVSDGTNYLLLSKGADSKILSRLAKTEENEKAKLFCTDKLEEYATNGLRTLVLAQKKIMKKEFFEYEEKLRCFKMKGDEGKKQIEELNDTLEGNLNFVGATGIEDMLQNDLKATLNKFLSLKIKFWMLTGDHPTTAVNIANSCGVIDSSFSLIELTKLSELEEKLKTVKQRVSFEKCCLVITGEVISFLSLKSNSTNLELVNV